MCDWRTPLSEKVGKLSGISSLHDFVYTTNPVTSKVVAKTCTLCNGGRFNDPYGHVLSGKDPNEVIIPDQTSCSFNALGKTRALTDSKSSTLNRCTEVLYRLIAILTFAHPNSLSMFLK